MYAALMALPWGGADLAQSAPADLDRLFARVSRHLRYLRSCSLLILQSQWSPADACPFWETLA